MKTVGLLQAQVVVGTQKELSAWGFRLGDGDDVHGLQDGT